MSDVLVNVLQRKAGNYEMLRVVFVPLWKTMKKHISFNRQ